MVTALCDWLKTAPSHSYIKTIGTWFHQSSCNVTLKKLLVLIWLNIAVMHTTYAVVKIKPEKNSGPNGTRTHHWPLWYQCIAVLCQPSYMYQADWELYNCGDQSCCHIFRRSSNKWSFLWFSLVNYRTLLGWHQKPKTQLILLNTYWVLEYTADLEL